MFNQPEQQEHVVFFIVLLFSFFILFKYVIFNYFSPWSKSDDKLLLCHGTIFNGRQMASKQRSCCLELLHPNVIIWELFIICDSFRYSSVWLVPLYFEEYVTAEKTCTENGGFHCKGGNSFKNHHLLTYFSSAPFFLYNGFSHWYWGLFFHINALHTAFMNP